jgi:hypothetical protein
MKDKNMDRDEYYQDLGNNPGDEVSDDDLDLSELLEKYMLEPQNSFESGIRKTKKADLTPDEAVERIIPDDESVAEEVDASVYSEFASEVYSDEDAARAASEAAAVLENFEPEDDGGSGLYRDDDEMDQVLEFFDKNADYSSDDGVYGDNEGNGDSEAPIEDAIENVIPTFTGVIKETDVPAEDEAVYEEPAADEEEEVLSEDVGNYEEPSAEDETVYPEDEVYAGDEENASDEYAYDSADVQYDTEGSDYAEEAYVSEDDADPEEAYYAEDKSESVYQDPEEEAYYAEDQSEEIYQDTGDYDGPGYEEQDYPAGDEAEEAEYDDGLYVDGSEYADDLADLSAFAEGDEALGYASYDEADGGVPDEEDAAADDGIYTGEEDASDEDTEDFVDYEAQEEEIDIDENVDSTDINLMLAFGLDDELERTMGAENAQRLTKELDDEQRKRDEHVRKTVDNEYMNRSQTAGIAKEYKRRYVGVRVKLAIASVLSIVLFFYENLRLFKLEFTGAFDATIYPTVYIMGSLQLLLIIAACAYEQIFAGFVRLFKGKPDNRSVTAIAVTAGVMYSAILPGITTIAHRPLVLNFAVALIVLFTLIAEYYNVRREIFAFNIISSKKPKHVITKGEIADSGFDTADGDVLKFETASFVDNFFTRTNEPVKASKTYAVAAIVIALFSAALSGIVTSVSGSGAALIGSVVENSFCGFFIALPVSMMIAASYPFYRAARSGYDIDGAIIGETSLEEYSDASCVTFDDIGVFPSYGVRVQNVKIYNNHRIDRVLYYAASVFSVARGPLTDVFDMATVEIGHSDEVKIRAAGSGYLSATVDDKNITFGSAAELITRGFDIPENVTDEDDFDDEDVSVMYMFREDRLMAKLFIKYTIDADFETIIASLCEEGISVSIKTYDPNIDRDLIASGLSQPGEYSYSVTRYDGADDGSTVRDNADSGIVSRSSAKTLLQLISDCTKVLASRRAATIIGIISSIVAAIILLIVIVTGNASSLLPGRMSAIIAIYQIFWMVPAYISAKINVR